MDMSGRNFSLTERLSEFINQQVEDGRHQNASEVVREALRRYQDDLEAERTSLAAIETIANRGRLILGFGVLAEACAGCDHGVRWQIMAFFDSVWLLQWPASPISRY
jgi:putative addiction module CopG family antidote